MRHAFIYTLLAATLAACSTGRPAAAQTPIAWSLARLRTTPRSGSTLQLRVDARIQPGWHIYSITQAAGGPTPTRLAVPAGQDVALSGDAKPTVRPRVAYDDAFKMNVELHEHAVSFIVPVRANHAPTATDSAHVNVRYQVCNASLCYPPQTARLATPLIVASR